MPNQDNLFWQGEGDAWFRRNREALHIKTQAIEKDHTFCMVQKFLEKKPRRILEVGCSNGWRLAELNKQFKCVCVGVEPSMEAIREGKKMYPGITLKRGVASSIPVEKVFDLVIVSFVFHWISREMLLKSVGEIDRVLDNNGYLIISDFLPDFPNKVPYHHLPKKDAYTYKLDYANIFTSSALYTLVARITFDHDNKKFSSSIPSHRRGVCSLLRKSFDEFYLKQERVGLSS